ncbi:hypothetical protein C8R43DRAFT_677934 [Mycena crocata]|nr:hypothetical protein C8R43DRAFT_677934 [Mycena crocata]
MCAANGSLNDLERLHGLIPDPPNAQLRLFIPALYANLNASDIPGLRRQLETDCTGAQNRISKAILALKGLSELKEHLVSRACSEVWSSAWKWIQFLDEYDKKNSKLHTLFLSTILALNPDADAAKNIKDTPRIYVFIAKGWIAVLDDDTPAMARCGTICVMLN